MGWQLRKRIRLFPGVGVNLSKHGPSLTLGWRGYHVTVGHGHVTRTVSIPGTGIFYTSRHGIHSGLHTTSPDSKSIVLTVLILAAVYVFRLAMRP